MLAPRSSLTLAFPLLATALAPGEADACPMPYECQDAWVGLHLRTPATIPIDGVLVLEGQRFGEADPLAHVTLEVTRDGQPIAGALETTVHRDALIWRPAEPWQPGTYNAQGAAENAVYHEYCGLPLEQFGGDFTVEADPGDAPGAPAFTATVTQSAVAKLKLETLACCVGADAPSITNNYCGGTYFDFDPTQCGPTQSVGYFELQVVADPVAPAPTAGQILYTVKFDDDVVSRSFDPQADFYELTAPVCVTVEALDLGTGDITTSAEQCFGQDIVAELGPQTVLPALECLLEQCAVLDLTWDKTDCTPLTGVPISDTDTGASGDTSSEASGTTDPGETDDKGCACTETAPSAPLLAAPLVLLARRRRR